jgi:hypothetical protein
VEVFADVGNLNAGGFDDLDGEDFAEEEEPS